MKFAERVSSVRAFLASENIRMDELRPNEEGTHLVRFKGSFSGGDGVYRSLVAVLRLDDRSIQTFVYFPVLAKGREHEMSEFVVRANYGLKMGRLELDFDDGEIAFHYGQGLSMFETGNVNDWLQHQLYYPLMVANSFSKGIDGVVRRTLTVDDAIKGVR